MATTTSDVTPSPPFMSHPLKSLFLVLNPSFLLVEVEKIQGESSERTENEGQQRRLEPGPQHFNVVHPSFKTYHLPGRKFLHSLLNADSFPIRFQFIIIPHS
eukprot:scaffold5893_cov178-Ochromonas_danica.AAC.4